MRTSDSLRLKALFERVRGPVDQEAAYQRGRRSGYSDGIRAGRVEIPGTARLPMALIEQLAPREPFTDHGTCEHCKKPPDPLGLREDVEWHSADRRRVTHRPDCPWIIARSVLGDPLES